MLTTTERLRFSEKWIPEPNTGCHLWIAAKSGKGYGRFTARVGGAKRTHGAHRIAWTLTNGPIPAGMLVCHKCDNPPCVNPEHLFLGTPMDNTSDMKAKGRGACGEASGGSQLTSHAVTEIRALRAGGALMREIAARFGVHKTTILNVLHGNSWKAAP